jgi:hypothetical protein
LEIGLVELLADMMGKWLVGMMERMMDKKWVDL